MELAYDYLAEAALMDLDDLEHNTRDGLHIASLAGAWIVAVAGFGGMRDHDGVLSFAPRLPDAIRRLAFRLSFRGRRLLVEVRRDHTSYTLVLGEPLEIIDHGEAVTVSVDRRVTRSIPSLPYREPPVQPKGRAPARRRPLRGKDRGQ
jgi:alpha,alpha-trehalose phosphorylase